MLDKRLSFASLIKKQIWGDHHASVNYHLFGSIGCGASVCTERLGYGKMFCKTVVSFERTASLGGCLVKIDTPYQGQVPVCRNDWP